MLPHLLDITAGKKIMVGFDRGGAYPSVLRLLPPGGGGLDHLPARVGEVRADARRYWLGAADGTGQFIDVADEIIELEDYGRRRPLSVFENGQLKLQILTSDTTAPASALAAWLRCRWRIENVLKYLAAHLGSDAICDYLAGTGPDTRRSTTRPARTPTEPSATPRQASPTPSARPDTPRIAHALALLLDELTATAPRIPGDPRPITYGLAET